MHHHLLKVGFFIWFLKNKNEQNWEGKYFKTTKNLNKKAVIICSWYLFCFLKFVIYQFLWHIKYGT